MLSPVGLLLSGWMCRAKCCRRAFSCGTFRICCIRRYAIARTLASLDGAWAQLDALASCVPAVDIRRAGRSVLHEDQPQQRQPGHRRPHDRTGAWLRGWHNAVVLTSVLLQVIFWDLSDAMRARLPLQKQQSCAYSPLRACWHASASARSHWMYVSLCSGQEGREERGRHSAHQAHGAFLCSLN